MDIVTIESTMLRGKVTVPPSKSAAHRAIIASALAGGRSTVDNLALSADISATLDCMRQLGAGFVYREKTQQAVFRRKAKRSAEEEIPVLDCGESGSTLRFFIPLALVLRGKSKFTGHGRLMQRPQKPYYDVFDRQGIKYRKDGNTLELDGRLKAGTFSLPGNVSSQFVTGLLYALPLLTGDSIIEITTPMESKGYIDLTLDVLDSYGISVENRDYREFHVKGGQKYLPRHYRVEGDYSQAAFFLTAGALGCDIACSGLRSDSLQGDKKILDILRECGALVTSEKDGTVTARRTAVMHGITIDAREIPDLVPILAVLCTFCTGESKIINAGRLRIKESDRLAAITAELNRMGARIEEHSDSLTIYGVGNLHGGTVSAWNDHRIAMALAVAACRAEGALGITGAAKAVTKSYPDFFTDYIALGGQIKTEEQTEQEEIG